MATPTDTLLNTLFDRRYRIVRKLGAGGMANVYLAEDQELGRRVAIKILNERHAVDDQFVERFRREAKNAAALSHPNIVSIYDRGEAEGTYYIAMEHLDGRNLKELILARGPAPPRIAADFARQILAALRFAHRHGIVHRDIKPHNVLVDRENRLKVTDFGIARAGATQMTEAGSIVGTAQYLSPEQARGAPVDQRSDLYSLGVVLYELLTGTVPFTGDAPVEIAMKHISETPVPPSQRRPGLPRELDLIAMRALAKDPDERYADAEEMDHDLRRFQGGRPVSTETEEAATSIMAAPSTMPTTIARAPTAVRTPPAAPRPYPADGGRPPAVVYDYESARRRRRPVWPWVIALLLVAAAIAGGWYAYDRVQEQLTATRPVAVPLVEGVRRQLATRKIRAVGLRPDVSYEFSDEVAVGHVIRQDPRPGDKVERGNIVSLVVSYGRQRVEVPGVKGEPSTQAVSELADAGLKARLVEVPSTKDSGTVVAQDPGPGEKVPRGSTVRLNVSSGPELVAVPSVVGSAYETAAGQLQGAGFAVARRPVESDEPEGVVVAQNPGANSSVAKGSKVTLDVSRGPKTVEVPGVEGVDARTASATLKSAGFTVAVTREATTDASLDGVVVGQDPQPGTRAKQGSRVSIVVGRFDVAVPQPPQPSPPPAAGGGGPQDDGGQ